MIYIPHIGQMHCTLQFLATHGTLPNEDTQTEDRFWKRISLGLTEYKSPPQEFVHSMHIDIMMDWELINYHQ